MRIHTRGTSGLNLQSLRPRHKLEWHLVVSGHWSEDRFHSGHIAYYLAKAGPGDWILEGVERNTSLDDVTQEDVDAGRLNDDQIQALWGTTLEAAQNAEYREIVAACTAADVTITAHEIAVALYKAACKSGAKEVTDPDDNDGILCV